MTSRNLSSHVFETRKFVMAILHWIKWCFTPLLTLFQSYHGDSSHYSSLSWVSPVLGWGSEVSCPRTLPRKTQMIRCGSNPGPVDYESNTLPLSHAGPLCYIGNKACFVKTIKKGSCAIIDVLMF